MALHNLASLPHISIAGAIATATHGSGDANGNLATAVRGRRARHLRRRASSPCARGEPDFDGVVVGLGALGVVTRVTLDVEPAYEVRQRVFEGLSWDALHEHFDAITAERLQRQRLHALGRDRRPGVDQEPRHRRARAASATSSSARSRRRVDRHPILGLDAVNCTPQLGVPGPWSDRLPHFRMGFTPSNGEEIQSEYHVPRHHAEGAIRAVHAPGRDAAPRAPGLARSAPSRPTSCG